MSDHIIARMTSDKLTADLEYNLNLKDIYENAIVDLQTCLDEPIPVYGPYSEQQIDVMDENEVIARRVAEVDHLIRVTRNDIRELAVKIADAHAHLMRRI
jgi:hypothetical protein